MMPSYSLLNAVFCAVDLTLLATFMQRSRHAWPSSTGFPLQPMETRGSEELLKLTGSYRPTIFVRMGIPTYQASARSSPHP